MLLCQLVQLDSAQNTAHVELTVHRKQSRTFHTSQNQTSRRIWYL